MDASLFIPFLRGLGLSAGLIIAIGAQNAFVLRQGLKHEHHLLVAALCALSDALLILAGGMGLGYLVQEIPLLLPVAKWVGVIFLLYYASQAARRAMKPESLSSSTSGPSTVSMGKVVWTTLAFTWLNPHVYLDTVLLVGGLASTFSGLSRIAYLIGAIGASFVWFFGLSIGAAFLAPLLRSTRAWQLLEISIALILLLSAGLLISY